MALVNAGDQPVQVCRTFNVAVTSDESKTDQF